MLIKTSIGLTAKFAPGPELVQSKGPLEPRHLQRSQSVQTREGTQQLVDLILGRTRRLSYTIASMFAAGCWQPADVEDEFESMRMDADKNLMLEFKKAISSDKLKGISFRPNQ